MKKGNPKDKQKQNIVGKPLKDIIPSSFAHVRDPKEIEYPQQGEKIYTPENTPTILFPEWPNNETDLEELLKSLAPPETEEEKEKEKDKESEDKQRYEDPENDKVFLPLSLFTDYLNMNVKWSRPEYYITEIYLDKLIQKQMPKKNPFKFRAKVHECYEQELRIRKINEAKKLNEGEDSNENENKMNSEDSESDIDKKDEFFIYRDFFKILDQPLEIKVVNSITRMETEEEMNERIKKHEEEMQQSDKNKKAKKQTNKNVTDIPMEKIEITVPSPNDINLRENIPPFSRWVGSIFQIIKDRNLLDVKTGENIWQKIYPQKNGVPIYNENGHYIVKLYHMGKLRKIEIDDRMPVSQNDEYFLPRCESLEEIWPAILTKALLKLYSYKIISNRFYEIGDAEPFYALTGYVPTLLKEVKMKNINNKQNQEDKQNQSQNMEFANKNNQEINNEKNKLNDSLDKNDNNNEENNNDEDQPEVFDEEQLEKINFLEKALTDENYTNSNYLVECYKTLDKKFYKVQNDLNNLEEDEEEQIIQQMHINDNAKSSDDNQEDQNQKKDIEAIPEENEIKVVDNAIESMPEENAKRSTNNLLMSQNPNRQKLLASLTINSDFSQTEFGRTEFRRIHEKLENYSMENNLFKGILYDIVDFFDNKEYNMNRLQPIDFSDLKQMLKDGGVTGSIKTTTLGYIQRGGTPSMQDRLLAAEFGIRAVNLLIEGKGGRVVGIRDNKIVDDDISEALAMPRNFNAELYKYALTLGK